MPLEVILVREGTKLAAADPISADEIASINEREKVTATIRRSRNAKHHRKFFVLLKLVYENQTTHSSEKLLLNAIKIATGHFEMGTTADGIAYPVAKSISFTSMCQTEFEQFYDKALEVILTKIVPNANRSDLEARLHDILEGDNHGWQRQ